MLGVKTWIVSFLKPDASGLAVKDDGDLAPVLPPYPLQHVDQQLLPLWRHLRVLDVPRTKHCLDRCTSSMIWLTFGQIR